MEYGLIGKSLKHSISSEIHPQLFDCKYEHIELKEDEIGSFFQKKDFKGINVTIPYKQAVIPYIDVLDDTAKMVGAVNTIVNNGGKLYGYNTDFYGLISLINKNNVSLENRQVLILGNGGTSLTAKAVANHLGAREVIAFSRKKCDGCETYDNIEKYYDTAQVIINTTPCGMFPNNHETVIDIRKFNCLEAVFDAIYNPIRSKLIYEAQKMGIVAEGGTYMLVFQAIYAARLFSNLDIPEEKGIKIYDDIIKSKENIVLIGMPTCGKSTIGKLLAEKYGREFIDTDEEILKFANSSPKDIIENFGEDYFREIEIKVVSEISKKQNAIISTGGGIILRSENIDYLKENGKIVFLNKDLDDLFILNDRPLSSTKEQMKKLYNFRMPLYEKYADISVKVSNDVNKTFENVLEAIKK